MCGAEQQRDRGTGEREGETERDRGQRWGGGGIEGERKEGGPHLTHGLLQGPPEEDEDYPRDHEGKGCAQ